MTFSEKEHALGNPVASFECARESTSQQVNYICYDAETKSTHQPVVSQQSTQSTTNCGYRHARKTSGLFYGTAQAATLAPVIILPT